MTELPPLPPPDLGSIWLNSEEISLGHSDEALRAYAEQALKQEREATMEAAENMLANLKHAAALYAGAELVVGATRARSEQGTNPKENANG